MSDIPEGLGTAAESGLLSRAVEPETGEGRETGHGECLNCGTRTIGPHCHQCGQKTHLHRSLSAFLHDLLHGALHLDGKVWRTLPLLAWKPGQLTRRYIEGERARFVSPMALFLFSVFLMFAVFQIAGLSVSNLGLDNPERVWNVDAARADLATDLATAREERQEIESQLAATREQGGSSAEIARLEDELDTLDQRIANYEEGWKTLAAVPFGDPDIERTPASNDDTQFSFNATGIKTIDEGIVKKWRTDPGLMLYKMQTNFYKFSWLLIPISLPFMWSLFFWKRRFRIYDHAIFVTYSIAFMSLLLIMVTFAGLAGAPPAIIVLVFLAVPPLHLYRQLRGTYDLSRFSAFWRVGALLVFVVVILGLFLQVLFLMGLF